ncbi:hypothetical protein [Actinomadura algeriensis]|uniref:Uncharacterized protein n=1 Tax=Actinomadura algeriensis TaxID=1679523 RepID=A0ABR9JPI0_9ACTN|nr:hypothetical protein [Actinomadura algeriensis]MBE1532276.1 hypothetical protein [Actinomadura algeriensis]
MKPKPNRSPFADRREDVVPRGLRDLLATEAGARPHGEDERRGRRRRRTMTVRRAP